MEEKAENPICAMPLIAMRHATSLLTPRRKSGGIRLEGAMPLIATRHATSLLTPPHKSGGP